MVSRLSCCFLCFLALTALAGCSSVDRPETVPVSGVVTFNGEPLAGATVNFMAEGAPRAASGTTDSEGKFQLTTYEENDGAVIGKHKVTITKVDTLEGEGMDASEGDADYAAAMAGAASGKSQRENEIPAKYGDPAQSGLSADVTADGANEFTFELQP